jgi:hypothetical protein
MTSWQIPLWRLPKPINRGSLCDGKFDNFYYYGDTTSYSSVLWWNSVEDYLIFEAVDDSGNVIDRLAPTYRRITELRGWSDVWFSYNCDGGETVKRYIPWHFDMYLVSISRDSRVSGSSNSQWCWYWLTLLSMGSDSVETQNQIS